MTDNKENIAAATLAEEKQENISDSIPNEDMLIPVKFNKEIKNITLKEAVTLAQKGMKFDLICDDFEALKNLAVAEGKSVSEYIEALKGLKLEARRRELEEKCGGDKDLAEHFLNLEQADSRNDGGFEEVKKHFPEINAEGELPWEVLENSKLKGTKLLDEYLRYLLSEARKRQKAEADNKKADKRSLGSFKNKNDGIDPEAAEFIKGLWK